MIDEPNDQNTVLAKPASKVMPVMVGPASRPSNVPMVAKAASYSPIAMPTPSTPQPRYQTAMLGDTERIAWPAATTTMLAAMQPLPPFRSIQRPTLGAQNPAISNEMVNAPNRANVDWPK